jgi:hypothetical protein
MQQGGLRLRSGKAELTRELSLLFNACCVDRPELLVLFRRVVVT